MQIQNHEGRLWKRIRVVLIYALAGPPVGAMLTTAGASIFALAEALTGAKAVGANEMFQAVVTLVAIAPLAASYSYVLGGVQAASTGLLLALVSKNGRFTYGEAFGAAFAVCAIWGLVLIEKAGMGTLGFSGPVVLVTVGVLASGLLRFLFRRIFAPVRDSITLI